MYQVVELYGQFEPWWFLEDWKEDIVGVGTFDHFQDALDAFTNQWNYLKQQHQTYRSQSNLLAAFWDEQDQSYCDDCDEPQQNYYSLALLENWEEVSDDHLQLNFDKRNDSEKPLSACKLKKIG